MGVVRSVEGAARDAVTVELGHKLLSHRRAVEHLSSARGWCLRPVTGGELQPFYPELGRGVETLVERVCPRLPVIKGEVLSLLGKGLGCTLA
jgi:hypothetical protein